MFKRLEHIESLLEEVLSIVRRKKCTKEKQREYYLKRREKTLINRIGLLRNPDGNNLTTRDMRLDQKLTEWADIGVIFAKANKPAFFLEWLSYQWNQNTYFEKIITASSGYYHLFIGWSGTKALRQKVTTNDLFGKLSTKFTFQTQLNFSEALWWSWSFHVLYKVLQRIEEDSEKIPEQFLKVVRLMCGSLSDIGFDPNSDLASLNTAMRRYYPFLKMGFIACTKGIRGKVEPHTEFLSAHSL
jgi:hypothetical protein